MVDRAVPLVEQVRQQLLRWIRDESLVADDGSLPSESDIAERLAVSRATVRDALARLERDRVIIRRHGAGTYVNPAVREFKSGIDVLRDPAALIEASGRKAAIGFHEARAVALTDEAAEVLDVSAGHPAVALSVVYLADARPAIWLDGLIPVADPRDNVPAAYATLARLVSQVTGEIVTHSIATLEAALADAPVSRHLKLEQGSPLLSMRDIYLNDEGAPVFATRSYFSPGVIPVQVLRKTDSVSGRGRVSVW